MLSSLAEKKIPVRGAVTVGAGAVLEDGSFYGPALAEAHHLESEVAGYPRVVISDTARLFLDGSSSYSKDPEMDKIMKLLAGLCRTLICQDMDGCWIVDFLGQGMRKIIPPDPLRVEVLKNAYDFVRSEAERFRQARDIKLALRYHLLREYIESRLALWS